MLPAEASTLTTTDTGFVTTPQIAAEKLCGWSMLLHLFHEVADDVALTERAARKLLG